MEGSETLNAGSVDAKAVCDEIAAYFRDVPRPDRCPRFDIYDDEAERLDYLIDKTWLDIASDLKYLTLHTFGEFIYMTEECFFYFFPGYLLGVINHKRVFLERVAESILEVLSTPNRYIRHKERFFYISPMLT